jgi:hypothetical protein
MSEMKGRSVPLNQKITLPGGKVITRMEMDALLKGKGISIVAGAVKGGTSEDECSRCGQYCGDKCNPYSCVINNQSLFGGLLDAEVEALLRAGAISLGSMNTRQLEAIRPLAQGILSEKATLNATLSPEQMKAIKG